MQKWEYRYLRTEDPDEAIQYLSELGLEGWELAAIVPVASRTVPFATYAHELLYVFKRPKP